ncbi:FES [Mytilus edulis]|uniref:FES n=1 Tax=Mytilus edulis TaxID=6550 RepID=A0A8S3TEV1_MYTED|nr:FES [Mytilus edulis]
MSSPQANTFLVHCSKRKCSQETVNSLLRELKIRGLVPHDILTSLSDELLKNSLAHVPDEAAIVFHVCDHSKKKIREIVKDHLPRRNFARTTVIGGGGKIDLKDFKEFTCFRVYNELDVYKVAESIAKLFGINIENDDDNTINTRSDDVVPEHAVETTTHRFKDVPTQIWTGYRQHEQHTRIKSLEYQRPSASSGQLKRASEIQYIKRDWTEDDENSTDDDDTLPHRSMNRASYAGHEHEECKPQMRCKPKRSFKTVRTDDVTPGLNIDSFVDHYLMDDKEEHIGSFIKQSSSRSFVKCDLPMERKLSLYTKNPMFEDYQKDITTRIIPKLRKEHDIRSLSRWLNFDNYKVKEKVLSEMEALLISAPINSSSIGDVVHITDNILMCCFRRVVEADDTMCTALRVLTSCLAILWILNSETSNTTSYIQVQNITSRVHGDLNTIKRNAYTMVSGQINTLLELIQYFTEHSFQRNFLDEILTEPNNDKAIKGFSEVDHQNKFLYIFVLINMMLQRSSENIPELLVVLLKLTFDVMAKKQKHRQTLLPLLYVVNKGIVLRLSKGPYHEKNWNISKQSLLTCLRTYITSRRIDSQWRVKLLSCLNPLLFDADKEVVKEVLQVFEKCGYKNKHIRDIIFKHVQNLLTAINFRMFSYKKYETNHRPLWYEIPGKIWNEMDVSLHILLPTVKCLTSGSMEDYRMSAERRVTIKHLNSLENMRILQYENSHPNLVKLIAFQYRPLPLYYLTENHKNLHTHLLDRRQYHKWLSRDNLGNMTINVIDAVLFLHSKGMVHRNLTTHSFCINEHGIVMLEDFSLVKILQKTENGDSNFTNDVNDGDIPVLYSAPESVLEDKYDFQTDIWMVGLLLYGIYTHGGIPYTVYGLATEQILEYVVFQDLKPTKWPCIPTEIFKEIMACMQTSPDSREELQQIRKSIEEYLSDRNTDTLNRLSTLFEIDKMYPPPDCSEPEKGLPQLFVRLKQDLNPRMSYCNLRLSKIRSNNSCITLSDITAPDTPVRHGNEHSRSLRVEEPVNQAFVEDELPQMTEELCRKVLKMEALPTKIKRLQPSDTDYTYELHYKCQKGENIIDIASRNHYGAPGIDSIDIFYLGLTYNLIKFVHRMHSHQWLLRDLCGYSIFVDTNTLTVFMPRVGRFRRINSLVKLDDCLLDESFPDRLRWSPIEVIQNGLYSKESDIYMLGMTIWEMYTAFNLHRDDPSVNPLEGIPFATIPKNELLTELYSGEVPDMPTSCPLWLYDMLKSCWNRNRTFRPCADQLLSEVKDRIQSHPKKEMIIQMVDLRRQPNVLQETRKLPKVPSHALDISFSKTSKACFSDDEDPYLLSVHSDSRSDSLHVDRRKQNTNSPWLSPVIKGRKPQKNSSVHQLEDDYPKLRHDRGRKNRSYEPSGYYCNESDSSFLNISQSETQISHETIREDNDNFQSVIQDISHETNELRHNSAIGQACERKLSRIDSGIVDDASNQQLKSPRLNIKTDSLISEQRKSGMTDPSSGYSSMSKLKTESENKKPPPIPPIPVGKSGKIPTIPSSKTSEQMNDYVSMSSVCRQRPNTDISQSSGHSVNNLPSQDITIKSKDDLDTDDFKPNLIRFRSCNLLKFEQQLSNSRSSYV